MTQLSWNYRGLNNSCIVPILHDFVYSYRIDVMVLCETPVYSNKIKEIHSQLGFDACFAANNNGRSEGLALM